MLSFGRPLLLRNVYMPAKLLSRVQNLWNATHLCYSKFSGARIKPKIMKLDTPEFKSIFTPELCTLADLFSKYGYEIRLAGGAVRDMLMGMTPKDLDFATVATPDQMKEMFTKEEIRMINMKGESHGTITARINDKENFEITTLRIDVQTDGRHAAVEFTTDWQLDANRRDLTINSLFLGLDGTVYDYFHGYEDLQKRRVVFVGSAVDRIKEDYLRILRYFRFFGRIAEYPDRHEKSILEAIHAHGSGLAQISGERIWNELRLIISGNFGYELLKKMLDLELGPYMGLPENPNIQHFNEVIDRTKGIELNPISVIASLLHNQEEVVALNTRLKVSAFERELALFIVEHREVKFDPKPLLPYQKLIIHTKKKVSDVHQWCVEILLYKGQHNLAEELRKWRMPRFPITGHHLKDKIPSKKFATVITALKDYWADNDFNPTSEEILAQLPIILDQLGLFPKQP